MATSVEVLTNEFVATLSQAIEANIAERLQVALNGAPAGGTKRGGRRGRRGTPGGLVRRQRSGPVSPARRLQGQYLGRLRALKGANRARVKAIAKQKGVATAVKEANKILAR
jgi:hypothetical protein